MCLIFGALKGSGSIPEEPEAYGTTGTCLSYLLLALLGQHYFSGLGILSVKINGIVY